MQVGQLQALPPRVRIQGSKLNIALEEVKSRTKAICPGAWSREQLKGRDWSPAIMNSHRADHAHLRPVFGVVV
eukprot:1070052-Amphidinium_carterae.1